MGFGPPSAAWVFSSSCCAGRCGPRHGLPALAPMPILVGEDVIHEVEDLATELWCQAGRRSGPPAFQRPRGHPPAVGQFDRGQPGGRQRHIHVRTARNRPQYTPRRAHAIRQATDILDAGTAVRPGLPATSPRPCSSPAVSRIRPVRCPFTSSFKRPLTGKGNPAGWNGTGCGKIHVLTGVFAGHAGTVCAQWMD